MKLKGKAKEEFLAKMARGRAKAKRNRPPAAKKKRAAKKRPVAKKKKSNPKKGKLTGAKKAAFLKRMARGRAKARRKPVLEKRRHHILGTGSRDVTHKFKPNRSKGERNSEDSWIRGLNLPAATYKKIMALSATKLRQIRANLQEPSYSDQETRRAAAEYAADGGRISDLLPRKSRSSSSGGKKNPKRRNSASIEAMYEKFHQKAPGRIVDYEELVNYPDAFAELGELRELRFMLDAQNKDFPLKSFSGAKVCSDAAGENLYFIGGDQAVPLASIDIASDKNFVELGPCTYIAYKTIKGFHDFEPTIYWHRFGEENGIMPVLLYDQLNKTLFLGSGDYRVKRAGITN